MSDAVFRDLLLDTHIVIWLATDPDRIPSGIHTKIQQSKRRFVSYVSALEIQIKRTKDDRFSFSLEDLEQAMTVFSFEKMPLEYSDIQAFGNMRFLHSDPFDRLLMAQAANRSIHLVTFDRDISRTAARYKNFKVLGDQ